MSLYNLLQGSNAKTSIILELSGLADVNFARFRDCWLDGARKRTCVYTRLGGGNRECYNCTDDVHEAGCYGVTISELQALPTYRTDYDDDFDCTYATFEFAWPEATADMLAALADEQGPPVSGDARWDAVFAKLGITK